MYGKGTMTRRFLRLAMLPVASAVWLAVAPAAYADVPVSGTGPSAISFTPVSERSADGNTFIDYAFVENFQGIMDGTRAGTGRLVIHPDGTLNTAGNGTFTGTIAGRSGTAEIDAWATGTFTAAVANFTITHGAGGLAGVHAQGSDHGSATGPTTLAGVYSVKVNFSAP